MSLKVAPAFIITRPLAEEGKREKGALLSPFPLHLSPHLYEIFE
jgi:hypothetical protein